MAAVREHLKETSEKLKLTFSDLTAIDEEVAALTAGVGGLPLSEAATRVSQGARTAATVASRVLKAAKAAEAAAGKATAAVTTAREKKAAAAEAAATAAAAAAAATAAAAIAAQTSAAAAAAEAALEGKVPLFAPLDNTRSPSGGGGASSGQGGGIYGSNVMAQGYPVVLQSATAMPPWQSRPKGRTCTMMKMMRRNTTTGCHLTARRVQRGQASMIRGTRRRRRRMNARQFPGKGRCMKREKYLRRASLRTRRMDLGRRATRILITRMRRRRRRRNRGRFAYLAIVRMWSSVKRKHDARPKQIRVGRKQVKKRQAETSAQGQVPPPQKRHYSRQPPTQRRRKHPERALQAPAESSIPGTGAGSGSDGAAAAPSEGGAGTASAPVCSQDSVRDEAVSGSKEPAATDGGDQDKGPASSDGGGGDGMAVLSGKGVAEQPEPARERGWKRKRPHNDRDETTSSVAPRGIERVDFGGSATASGRGEKGGGLMVARGRKCGARKPAPGEPEGRPLYPGEKEEQIWARAELVQERYQDDGFLSISSLDKPRDVLTRRRKVEGVWEGLDSLEFVETTHSRLKDPGHKDLPEVRCDAPADVRDDLSELREHYNLGKVMMKVNGKARAYHATTSTVAEALCQRGIARKVQEELGFKMCSKMYLSAVAYSLFDRQSASAGQVDDTD